MEDVSAIKSKERKKYRRRETLLALGMASPYMIVFVLFTLVPVFLGIVFSFMRYNPYAPEENTFIGFQNFINLFNFDLDISKTFWSSFTTMFVFDIIAVPILLIVPLFMAYFINMRPPGYKIMRAIIFLPSIVSIGIVGIIFGNMFAGDNTGLINAWLGKDIKWLSGTPWHGDTLRWVIIMIACVWQDGGTKFVIFMGALRNVPKNLYEACEMDGGGRFQKFMRVTYPHIRPTITLCVFTTLISMLGLYGQPFVLNDMTNEIILVSPMMFIQNYLGGGLTYARQTGYFCACTLVFGLIVMLFGAIQRKFTAERRPRPRYTQNCCDYFAAKSLLASGERLVQNIASTVDNFAYEGNKRVYLPSKGKLSKSEFTERREKIVSFIVMFIVTCFFAFPLVYMLGTSFKSDLDLQLHPETLFPSSWDQWTLKHYSGFIVNNGSLDRLPIWMFNSLWSSAVSVALTVIFDLTTAFAFVFLKFKGKDKLIKFLFLWMAVPGILGTSPSFALFSQFKNFLQPQGMAGYFYIYLWLILPSCTGIFNMLLMRSFFLSIPKDIVESAKADGASMFTVFRRIVCPLAKSTSLMIILFSFTGIWNSLVWPQLLLSGEPDKWRTITYALTLAYTGGSSWGQIGVSMATSVFSLIPIIIIFIFTQNKMIDGLATSGIKM